MKQTLNAIAGAPSAFIGRRTRFARLITLLLLALGAAFVAHAQQTTATIVGNVTDASGAVIVGAKVMATNTATNTVRATVTDSSGQYSLPSPDGCLLPQC